MDRVRFAALVLCCVGVLFACSEDKPKSGSGSSSSSGGESKDDKDTDDPKPCAPEDEDNPDPMKPTKNETPEPVRGNQDSAQPESAALEGKELTPGEQYKGGDRVKVTNLGFSYLVPEGSISLMNPNSPVITIGETSRQDTVGIIFARTGVTEAEARDMLSKEFDIGEGTEQSKLQPVGELKKDGDTIARRMESTALVAYATVLLGKHTTVGVVALGLPAQADYLKTYSAKVASSVKYAKPGGEETRVKYENDLKGKKLHVFKYRSGGGGYGGASWSSETNKTWHLGSDRTYAYYYKHTGSSSFNNPGENGGHAADTDQNHEGTWSVELTLSLPMLVLRTNGGEIHTWNLDLVNGRLHIGGDEASISESDVKR